MRPIIIEEDLKKTIIGRVGQKRLVRNVLTRNFWSAITSLIIDSGVGFKRADNGANFTNNWSAEDTDAPVQMVFGTGTATPSFSDYKLQAQQESKPVTGAINIGADRITLQFNTTPDNDASEVGLLQDIYYPILYSRALATITGGQVTQYKIDFQAPWVRAYPLIFLGKMLRQNIDMVNMDGQTFTARTVGDTTASKLQLALVTEDVAYSPDLTSVPLTALNGQENIIAIVRDTHIFIQLMGYVLSATPLTVYGLAMYQQIFDTGSAKHNVLVAYWRFAEPVSVPANTHKFFVVRLVAH